MRELKIVVTFVASLVLTVLLGLAGCGENHGHRIHEDRDRVAPAPRYDQDPDRDRRDERHEDRGWDYNPGRGE